jgi:hypothetical protein
LDGFVSLLGRQLRTLPTAHGRHELLKKRRDQRSWADHKNCGEIKSGWMQVV